MRKTLRIGLGITLVIIGFIGGFIPILQGWLFMIPGLIILSEYFPPVKRLLHWAKARARKAGINLGDKDEDRQGGAEPPGSGPTGSGPTGTEPPGSGPTGTEPPESRPTGTEPPPA